MERGTLRSMMSSPWRESVVVLCSPLEEEEDVFACGRRGARRYRDRERSIFHVGGYIKMSDAIEHSFGCVSRRSSGSIESEGIKDVLPPALE